MEQLQKNNAQELAMQNLKNTGIDSRIIQASNCIKISDEEDERIRKALISIYALIGLQKLPDKIQDSVNFAFIKSNLKNFSINEFFLAFEYAVKGITDVDVKHYNSFNPVYIQQMINAYSKYKFNHIKKFNEMNKQEDEISQTEKNKIVLTGLLNYLEKKPDSILFHYYDFLVEKGVLKVTNEDKKAYFTLAEKQITREINSEFEQKRSSGIRVKIEDMMNSNFKEKCIIRAKELIFKDFIIKSENVNLIKNIK